MVRIKERYLLVNIIYPDGERPAQKEHANVRDVILYNQPTTDALTPQTLLKGIRTSVRTLFGDYGSGVLDRSLQGLSIIHYGLLLP
jgi:ribonuclease P/MRP protein subunit POP5